MASSGVSVPCLTQPSLSIPKTRGSFAPTCIYGQRVERQKANVSSSISSLHNQSLPMTRPGRKQPGLAKRTLIPDRSQCTACMFIHGRDRRLIIVNPKFAGSPSMSHGREIKLKLSLKPITIRRQMQCTKDLPKFFTSSIGTQSGTAKTLAILFRENH